MNTLFKIDLEIYCNCYKVDNHCMNAIGTFLLQIGKTSSICDLYEDFINRQSFAKTLIDKLPYRSAWKENYKDGNTLREMINQLYKYPDIVNDGNKINWYYFPYYDSDPSNEFAYSNFSNGVILNTHLLLDYKNTGHQAIFRLLFASMLSQTQWPGDFLRFHFEQTFEGDKKEYILFKKLVIADHSETLQQRLDFFNTWDELALQNVATISSHKKVSQAQVAVFLVYKQMAGTLPEWKEGTKGKEILKWAQKYDISKEKLMKTYRLYHDHRDSRNNIHKWITKPENQKAIEQMLQEDASALLELKRDINKLSDRS